MAIYLTDLIGKPGLLDEFCGAHQNGCACCQVVLQETITGKRRTPQGDVCSDCYYEEMGEHIERHPIASAGLRRR